MNLFVQLYGNIDDLCNSRILEELDYYMYEVKNKNEMIYYFTKEQSIFLCFPSDTNWNMEKLQVLCRTALRENTFLMLSLDSYTGYMSQRIWDNIRNESVKFFKDPKSYRISMGRGNKLTKILNTIKRKIIKVK